MNKKFLVSFVFGTRPEVIKLAPVIKVFENDLDIQTRVIFTGQHRQMAREAMNLFSLKEDIDLDLMLPNQTLEHITCRAIDGLSIEFKKNKPSLVILQGDTSTAFCASISSFYNQIPVGHVEAGLRTDNLLDPFPEEMNRRLISQIATLHFAPTKLSKTNLENSNVQGKIFVTGNTVIDSLFMTIEKNKKLNLELNKKNKFNKVILTTVHRRENLGPKLIHIINAIKTIIKDFDDVCFLIPMHPNPLVRDKLVKHLNSIPQVSLVEPFTYDYLVEVMKNCEFVLTDSGGLQEEAPSLSKPVLVLRNTTERVESIESGTSKLIGTNTDDIVREISILLKNKKIYRKMSNSINPYGDGKASQKILKVCKEFFHLKN